MHGGQFLVLVSLLVSTNRRVVTSFQLDHSNRSRRLPNLDRLENAHSIRRRDSYLEATTKDFSVCVIGGGVSGLTAAITAANGLGKEGIIL